MFIMHIPLRGATFRRPPIDLSSLPPGSTLHPLTKHEPHACIYAIDQTERLREQAVRAEKSYLNLSLSLSLLMPEPVVECVVVEPVVECPGV